eukprot:scaffold36549_cov49-Cyclotella_meneghiniana.AAC.4
MGGTKRRVGNVETTSDSEAESTDTAATQINQTASESSPTKKTENGQEDSRLDQPNSFQTISGQEP